MKSSSFLIRLFWLLMGVFLVGRVGFMLYNAELWPSAADPAVTGLDGRTWLKDMILAWFHGAAQQDLFTVGALMALPALLVMCGVRRLRLWLTPYYIIMSIAVGVIIVADAVMYEFWQFKLSYVVFAYAAYPEGTANSVSPAFVATRLGTGIAFMIATIAACIAVTPKTPRPPMRAYVGGHTIGAFASRPSGGVIANIRRNLLTAVFTVIAFVAVAWGSSSVGSAYFSDRLFLNHAAVNPVFGFVGSIPVRDYADRYDYFDEPERAQLFEGLYAGNGAAPSAEACLSDSTPTLAASATTTAAQPDSAARLLRTDRPDILVIFAESFGSEFVTSLGGAKGTTPDGRTEDVDRELERLIPEGIWWTNYYSNSFRTDRGTVSAFCGWPAYTDLGLMTHTEFHASLPSLPRSLRRAGYDTSYLYPGAMTNMGKGTFLGNIGFEHLLDDTFFTPEELDSSWGASDSVSAQKVYRTLAALSPVSSAEACLGESAPRLFCYQTVSSHEPWDVAYSRLTDKVQNAFAYTDRAIGALVDSLKATPAWDNLLIVIIPDHGHLYKVPSAAGGASVAYSATRRGKQGALHRQAFDDPEFFHSPMLWLGGAIQEPRTIDVLMNQSDLCATLLGQLGLDHSDYPWSRDVLSPAYRYPFVYSVFPAGLLFRDATGTTIYDVTADRLILQHDVGAEAHYGPNAPVSEAGQQRIRRAKTILQTSYDGLRPTE